MHTTEAKKLMDRADAQWVSLRELVHALEKPLNLSTETVQRLISAYLIEAVRPSRIVFDDGTGTSLPDKFNSENNEMIDVIVGHQLKSSHERTQAPEQIQRISDGTVIEFTIPALYEWLVNCQLQDVADVVFGGWMGSEYPKLLENKMLVGGGNEPVREIGSSDLAEIHSAIVELRAANENHLPLDHGKLWKFDDVARYIGRSVQTVRRLAARNDFPSPIQVNDAEGRLMSPLFEPKSIVSWFAKHKLPSIR